MGRILLLPAAPALSAAVADYYRRNRAFLAPFEPLREESFFTADGQEALLRQEEKSRAEDRAYRFFIALRDAPTRVIGSIALSSLVRGAFQSCFMGYKLDEALQNQGYMTEAVQMAVDFAFEELRLHRIEANVMPRNKASLRVLEKNGFVCEGLSPKYLCIHGVWEDHVHMVRRNARMEEEC